MSATSNLLQQALPTGQNKTTLPASKNTSASTATSALLQAANIPSGGLKYVPASNIPATTPKKSIGSKIISGIGSLAKSIVEPITTTLARPLQAAAELTGVSDKKVNEISAKVPFGLVAPTPQNFKDVKKDVGRAIQTVATGIPGESLANTAIGGAAFGAGNSLEQGNDVLSKQTLIQTGVGGATGALLNLAFKGASKLLGKNGATAAEDAGIKATEDAIKPEPKYNDMQLPAPKPKEAEPIQLGGKQYQGSVEVKQAKKNPVTVNPITGKFQTTYSSSEGDTVAQRVIEGDVKPAKAPKSTIPEITNLPENTGTVRAPSSRLPSIKGDTVAKAAEDIDTKLAEKGFEALPEEEKAKFNSVNRKEQLTDISRLVKEDPEAANQMSLGKQKIPKEIDPQILFNTVAKKAEEDGNYDLLRDMAKSPVATQRSILAQKLGAAGVNKSEQSVVDIIAQNDRNIAENIAKKTGKSVEELQSEEVAKIKASKPKVDKNSFSEFIKSIQC